MAKRDFDASGKMPSKARNRALGFQLIDCVGCVASAARSFIPPDSNSVAQREPAGLSFIYGSENEH